MLRTAESLVGQLDRSGEAHYSDQYASDVSDYRGRYETFRTQADAITHAGCATDLSFADPPELQVRQALKDVRESLLFLETEHPPADDPAEDTQQLRETVASLMAAAETVERFEPPKGSEDDHDGFISAVAFRTSRTSTPRCARTVLASEVVSTVADRSPGRPRRQGPRHPPHDAVVGPSPERGPPGSPPSRSAGSGQDSRASTACRYDADTPSTS